MVKLTFDDGSTKVVTPPDANLSNTFYREITIDPLEEFSGFAGMGRGNINHGCDTDGLYVMAYKKCPYLKISPPDLSFITSEKV